MFFTKKYKKLIKNNNDLLKENNLLIRQLINRESSCIQNVQEVPVEEVVEDTDYLEQYKILHEKNKDFGTSSVFLKEPIVDYIKEIGAKEILDYGCGKGLLSDVLSEELSVNCCKYDPCIEQYSKAPDNKIFDLLINTDVLEHIPLDDLDNVLNHMSSLCRNAFINISCRRAISILPNGHNAHCTVFPPRWWQKKLQEHFKKVQEVDSEDITACSFIIEN